MVDNPSTFKSFYTPNFKIFVGNERIVISNDDAAFPVRFGIGLTDNKLESGEGEVPGEVPSEIPFEVPSTPFNPPGTKGFGTHTKHQGGGRKGPPPPSISRTRNATNLKPLEGLGVSFKVSKNFKLV